MPKWIWYPGDFEAYHSMLLHSRREEFGTHYPTVWHLSRPEVRVTFTRTVTTDAPSYMSVKAKGKGFVRINGVTYPISDNIPIHEGKADVIVSVTNIEAFPSIYVDSPVIPSDESWTVENGDRQRKPAATEMSFTSPDDDPSVFPFVYRPIMPTSVTETDLGTLYDFGVESFGVITLEQTADMGKIKITYGESREEALDYANAIVRETLPASDGKTRLVPRAFRYISVSAEHGQPKIEAESEELPVPEVFDFTSDDEALAPILEICRRTLRLTSREFYLDGIKRDRWVWSGDSYQSFEANRYFTFDKSIVRRTIRALLGKPPVKQHVNTINDYSAYLIISVWEYYYSTGDIDFVRSVWDGLKELYMYIYNRLDEKSGYVIQREDDWVFIDWADYDYVDPICAEQIIFWKCTKVAEALASLVGDSLPIPDGYADDLRRRIFADYYDEEAGAFIDSYNSGKRTVSRHPQIFAIIFGFVDDAMAKQLYESVLLGDKAIPISTPYFKYYELTAVAEMGGIEAMQDFIDEYWGGMVKLGATTVWEKYDPNESGTEHYAMYGNKFGCSLCHAWGAGPIALLGRFVAGVKPTSVGYATYTVEPKPGKYGSFTATVPINDGKVSVAYDHGKLTVSADRDGGTLVWMGKSYTIEKGKALTV